MHPFNLACHEEDIHVCHINSTRIWHSQNYQCNVMSSSKCQLYLRHTETQNLVLFVKILCFPLSLFCSTITFLFHFPPGGADVDLDAILGELCELETQLNESIAKGEKKNSATETGPAITPEKKNSVKEFTPAVVKPSDVNFDSTNDLDLQLLSALSELSAIAGGTFDDNVDIGGSTCPTSRTDVPTERNESATSSRFRRPSSDYNDETRSKQNDAVVTTTMRPVSGGSIGNTRQLSVDACMHDSSPDGGDADSAFSDNASLPSSGSHVSVATTSSQNSASSSGVGVSSSPVPVSQCGGGRFVIDSK